MDVAINLAMEGGFDNVRQRDVAAAAGVALGTLYKAFRSKEDILVAAVDRQAESVVQRFANKSMEGATPAERVGNLFDFMTRAMCRKPHYARSVIKAMASGEPEVTGSLASYRGHITRMVIAALRGEACGEDGKPPSEAEQKCSTYLQDIWFASLVGWAAGLTNQPQAIQHMRDAADALLNGIELG